MALSKLALCSSINNMAVEEEEEEADWCDLSYHLLDLIMDSLISPSIMEYFSHSISSYMTRYIRFGSVCMSWRSAFNDHNPRLLPLLMVPPSFNYCWSITITPLNCYRDIDNRKRKKKKMKQLRLRGFKSIFSPKVDEKLMVRMPNYQQCRGSSHGWLITVDDIEDYFRVQLFNPFLSSSGDAIVLPPLQSIASASHVLDYDYLCKAILSADPVTNPTEYTVMIIYGYSDNNGLALLKAGDKAWTRIKSPINKDFLQDVIYYQGTFFAINSGGIIFVCDDVVDNMTARVLLQPPKIQSKQLLTRKYIVKSSGGNLLQVHRKLKIRTSNEFIKSYATIGFRVFKLLHQTTKLVHQIATEEDYEWVELENLCGDAMFLGHNASMSIPASDFPGCYPNSIYYTDDSDFSIDDADLGPHDIGMFNLEERRITRDVPYKKSPPFVSIWPVPIWIQPSIQKSNSGSGGSFSNQNCL